MDSDALNLLRTRQRIACEKTAAYIEEKLPLAKPFKNGKDLLEYALSSTLNDGLYCEFGVYKGETINFIADRINGRTVYGFDSFEGLPENWKFDMPKGTFKIDGPPRVRNNVKLIIGLYENTLNDFFSRQNDDCAFVHIDCDLYSSTRTVFESLGDKIKNGTIIVFDEYFNYPGWENGEFKAFREYVKQKNIEYEYLGYCYLWRQAAVIIK